MGGEIELASAAVADVGVELRRREIGMAKHLLDAPEIGPALEQVGCERVPEEVRVDAPGLQPRLFGQSA